MDCTKLKADIERLREARDAFDAAVSAANDTGLGKTKCNEVMERASELEDEILQTYMEDAEKHNPELFRHPALRRHRGGLCHPYLLFYYVCDSLYTYREACTDFG